MAFIDLVEEKQANEIVQKIYQDFENQGNAVPEWAKVMAHCPQILKEFVELFKVIMVEGEIEINLKWKIAYMISQTLRCEFCVDVTEKMLKKLGADDEVFDNIKNLKNCSEEECQILALVKDVTLDGHLDEPEILEKLKQKLSAVELVEIVSVIGLFNYINRFNNTFAILPK